MPSDRRRRTGPAPTGFSSTGGRTALGYWMPLVVTVTVATVGLAAWVWSERSENESDTEEDEWEDEDDGGRHHGRHRSRRDRERRGNEPINLDPAAEGTRIATGSQPDDPGVVARMQGALRRSPSPKQFWDDASKRVVAGVTAAGAAVGGALTSIREEGSGNGDFEDHSRWADHPASPRAGDDSRTRDGGQFTMSGGLAAAQSPSSKKKRHTVAIVVSSVSATSEPADVEGHLLEHTSLLSLLPEHVDPEAARVFVLIYAPGMQTPPSGPDLSPSRQTLSSMSSSYDNIGRDEATTTGTPELVASQGGLDTSTAQFKVLHDQARVLVDKETMIMPFNTPSGHVPILRHLSPDVVYVQENLAGDDGESIQKLSGWVRQIVVVADESAGTRDERRWLQNEDVGPGKPVEVVDTAQIGNDWEQRIGRH